MPFDRIKKCSWIAAFVIFAVALAWVTLWASGTALFHETLTVGNSVVGPTQSLISQTSGTFIYQKATAALLVNNGSNTVLITEDGTAPVQGAAGTGKGYPLTGGSHRIVSGVTNVANIQMIAQTSGQTAYIEMVYYYGGEPYTF